LWHFRYLLLITGIVFLYTGPAFSGNVEPDNHVYHLLERLEAEGLIQSSFLTTKPLRRQEILRLILEAESNAGESSPFVGGLIQSVKEHYQHDRDGEQFLKPLENPFGQFTYADSEGRT
jgi:hypothetical protein